MRNISEKFVGNIFFFRKSCRVS